MNEKTIKLSQKQLEHLIMFLERTDLKGHEVSKFLEIARAIGEANVKEKHPPNENV